MMRIEMEIVPQTRFVKWFGMLMQSCRYIYNHCIHYINSNRKEKKRKEDKMRGTTTEIGDTN